MPRPTIDLQRDCELWCDFDTDYFDSQRNKILDRSGNGRHPVAEGGPTLGVNGPDNFEAASFDGNDDKFVLEDNGTFGITDKVSLLITIKVPKAPFGAGAANKGLIGKGNGGQLFGSSTEGIYLGINRFDNTLQLVSAGSLGRTTHVIEGDKFVTVVCVVNATNGVQSISVGGENVSKSVGGIDSLSTDKGAAIGNIKSSAGNREVAADIAQAGIWSRVLSDAEIEYLNRLTEPRRAQL
jgi:hypothetical protein